MNAEHIKVLEKQHDTRIKFYGDEIKRLRQQNAELVEALKALDYCYGPNPCNYTMMMQAWGKAKAAIAKAKGGE